MDNIFCTGRVLFPVTRIVGRTGHRTHLDTRIVVEGILPFVYQVDELLSVEVGKECLVRRHSNTCTVTPDSVFN